MQDSYTDITYVRRRYPFADRITPVWNPQRQKERLIGIKEEVIIELRLLHTLCVVVEVFEHRRDE